MNLINNLKLRTKLTLSFIIAAILGTVTMMGMSQVAIRQITGQVMPILDQAAEIQKMVAQVQALALEFANTGDEATRSELIGTAEVLQIKLDAFLSAVVGRENGELYEAFVSDIRQVVSSSMELVRASNQTRDGLTQMERMEKGIAKDYEMLKTLFFAEIQGELDNNNLAKVSSNSLPSLVSLTQFIQAGQSLIGEARKSMSGQSETTLFGVQQATQAMMTAEEEIYRNHEASKAGEVGALNKLSTLRYNLSDQVKNLLADRLALNKARESLDAAEASYKARALEIDQVLNSYLTTQLTRIRYFSLSISIAMVIFSVILGLGMANGIARPVERLTEITRRIGAGDLSMRAPVNSRDEIGVLAENFNKMTEWLNATISGLEKSSLIIQSSAEVSRRLSTILDEKLLVKEVVEQLQAAFNYYHVHAYFFDPAQENLVMMGGTGEAGQIMLARGHKLERGKGLVGRAADTNTVVLVPDTAQDPGWLPNRLLPDTKAEAAVPIAIGEQVVGVLDVQHNITGGLGDADVELLRSIASQVAIALQNARAYSETKRKAEREATLGDINQKIQASASVQEALKIAARELGRALGASETLVRLRNPAHSDDRSNAEAGAAD
jgi:putative methionine-R-sulfoxide reductase with GAF domain